MAEQDRIGREAEEAARQYLEAKGWRCLEMRWSCPRGEIDLVMEDQSVRVMVEVRHRSRGDFGEGAETVDVRKQKRIIAAALWYQQQQNYWGDIRFDVISVKANPKLSLDHIINAFEA